LGANRLFIDRLFFHTHALAFKTLDVKIAFNIYKMFRYIHHTNVVKSIKFFSLDKSLYLPYNYWNILKDEPFSDVLDFMGNLEKSVLVNRESKEYEIPPKEAALRLNVPVDLFELLHNHKNSVFCAGGAALALRYIENNSLMLPASDVDLFFLKTENAEILKMFVYNLHANGYVVCRSRDSVISAIHANLRTVQLIGTKAINVLELFDSFDFVNVQIFYDGLNLHETAKALIQNSQNTLSLRNNVNIVTLPVKRVQKMLLKGFFDSEDQFKKYVDVKNGLSSSVAYDYAVICNHHHEKVRDNILRKFGLVPIVDFDALEALSCVPTYQGTSKGKWIDEKTDASLQFLITFVKYDVFGEEKGYPFPEHLFIVKGLIIDLGLLQPPKYFMEEPPLFDANDMSTDIISRWRETQPSDRVVDISLEKMSFELLEGSLRVMEIISLDDFVRLGQVQASIIKKVCVEEDIDFGNKVKMQREFCLEDNEFPVYKDIDVKINSDTCFYKDDFEIESYVEIMKLAKSPLFQLNVYSSDSFILVLSNRQHFTFSYRFVLSKLVFVRKPGNFIL
jgi:hypothetical protein